MSYEQPAEAYELWATGCEQCKSRHTVHSFEVYMVVHDLLSQVQAVTLSTTTSSHIAVDHPAIHVACGGLCIAFVEHTIVKWQQGILLVVRYQCSIRSGLSSNVEQTNRELIEYTNIF